MLKLSLPLNDAIALDLDGDALGLIVINAGPAASRAQALQRVINQIRNANPGELVA